jgi:putative hydrolase of the HAD superfamily
MTPRALLAFDLMDTVVKDPFCVELGERVGWAFADLVRALDPQAWISFELGEIDEAEYLQRMLRSDVPAPPVSPQAVRRAIVTGYRYLEGMEALLSELCRAGARVWALSNYTPWADTLRSGLGLDRYFEGYVLSYQIGVRKPDPRAYAALCARCGAEPSQCLLVDDREANVEGAEGVGLPAILFRGAQLLRAELVRLGHLPGERPDP